MTNVRSPFAFQSCANSVVRGALAIMPLTLAVACGGGPQITKQPAQAQAVVAPAPTPATVTVKEPGGDATDAHQAALDRLLTAPWGMRKDKDDQLHVPMPDSDNWKRVRYFCVEHYVGFRYGDEHHAMLIAFVQDLPPDTPMKSDT